MAVTIQVKEHEPIDAALRRFKHEIQQEHVLTDWKHKQYYISKTQERRRKERINFLKSLKKKKRQKKRR